MASSTIAATAFYAGPLKRRVRRRSLRTPPRHGRFLLGAPPPVRLRGAVLLAQLAKTATMLDSLADYPRWFVVACGTMVAALLIWVVMKLLKLVLWLLIAAVLVVGLGTAAWLLLK